MSLDSACVTSFVQLRGSFAGYRVYVKLCFDLFKFTRNMLFRDLSLIWTCVLCIASIYFKDTCKEENWDYIHKMDLFKFTRFMYVTLGLIFSQLCCDLFKFTRIILLRNLRVIFSQLCFDLFKFTRIILLRKLRVIFRFLVNFAVIYLNLQGLCY